MAVNSGKQRFKHAESYARYRACKNFVRFSPSEQKIYNYLSKYFLVVFAGYCIHSFWVEQLTVTKWTQYSCNKVSFISSAICVCIPCYERIGSCFSFAYMELWLRAGS